MIGKIVRKVSHFGTKAKNLVTSDPQEGIFRNQALSFIYFQRASLSQRPTRLA
jgi:hypothetical protein